MSKIDFKDLTQDEILYLKAKYQYYEKASPIMSDEDFDVLEEHLTLLDSLVVDIIGTIKVTKTGFSIGKGKIKFVPHDTPMGSLDKVKFLSDYVPYDEFSKKFLDKHDNPNVIITGEPKLDGNAISMKYVNGHLIHVASRGDGVEGQDYTHLDLNVPKYVPNFTGEIRGEAVIEIDLFDYKYGPKSKLDKPFMNARNFVAGSLAKGLKERIADIDIVTFQIVGYTGLDTKRILTKWGFETLQFETQSIKGDLTKNNFEQLFETWVEYRKKSKYQLDGFVLKYPENYRDEIGGIAHHPFWAIAIKFIPEIVSTKVIDIEWNIGKRGQLAPVALLEPVELMGSIVRRASLYNASWLIANKCLPGATVTLVKSGDIIPKIVEVLVPSDTQFNLLTSWNDNNVLYNGVDLIVEGFENTPEYKSLILYHTISSLGIKGIGPATSAKISECGIGITELIQENPTTLVSLLTKDGIFKPSRELEVIINNVLDLNKVELWQIIYSFGYINCGKTISKQLANLVAGIKYDFKGLQKDVIEAFLNNPGRRQEIDKLVEIMQNANIQVIMPTEIDSNMITFEMTGNNPSGETKSVYKTKIELTGKAIHTSLKKETTYLVVGDINTTSGKAKTAIKNNIKLITYADFEELILSM